MIYISVSFIYMLRLFQIDIMNYPKGARNMYKSFADVGATHVGVGGPS